jgi:hypothetical protein
MCIGAGDAAPAPPPHPVTQGGDGITISLNEFDVIVRAVEALEKWAGDDYKNRDGWSPMWNPTLRTLRNLMNDHADERALLGPSTEPRGEGK